jgi:hypothetical protein
MLTLADRSEVNEPELGVGSPVFSRAPLEAYL